MGKSAVGVMKLTFVGLFLTISAASLADPAADGAAAKFRKMYGSDAMLSIAPEGHMLSMATRFFSPQMDRKNLGNSVRVFLLNQSTLLGLSALDDLAAEKVMRSGTKQVVHLTQSHAGLPVFRSGASALVDEQGRVILIASHLTVIPEMDLVPLVPADEARTEALSRSTRGIVKVAPELGLLPAGRTKALLAWRVWVHAPGPALYEVFVDAFSGRIIFGADRIMHANQADVYLENPDTTPDLTRVTLKYRTPGQPVLTGQYADVYSCTEFGAYGCTATTRYVDAGVEDAGADAAAIDGDFTQYQPIDTFATDDAWSEVSAYYHITDINRWVRDNFGYDGTYTGTPIETALMAIVNMDYENAFYSPSYGGGQESANYGHFGDANFAYDADVMCHEFGHSVNSRLFGGGGIGVDSLGLDSTSMGVDEGYADLITYVRHGNSALGEYGFGSPQGARNGENTRKCPDNLTGESHEDGWIVSGVGWDIYQVLNLKGYELMYRALQVSDPTIMGLAKAITATADVMKNEGKITDADITQINEAITAHGLDKCDRLVPLLNPDFTPADSRLTYGLYPSYGDPTYGMPFSVQHYVDTQPTTKDVKITISPMSIYSGTHNVFARTGTPVEYVWGTGGAYELPPINEVNADLKMMAADYTEALNEFHFNKYTMKDKFVPGQRIYLSLSGVTGNQEMLFYMIKAELSDQEPEPPADAGVDSGAGDADGDGDADGLKDSGIGDGSTDGGVKEEGGSGCGCSVVGADRPRLSFLEAILSLF